MDKKRDKNILTSLNHALKVLNLLSVRGEIGVSEIARLTGYDKSSVYKMLYTMEHRNFVVKTSRAKYQLSPKFVMLDGAEDDNRSVADVATSSMRRLRNECLESVYLGVLNTNGKVIFMCKEDGLQPHSIIAPIGYEIDAYTNATGKILLANMSSAMQESLVSRIQFRQHTARTVVSKEKLQHELDLLRGEMYAEQYDENYPGHSDIAAPIFNGEGYCIAALSIVCPSHIMKNEKSRFLPLLLQYSSGISRKMGYRRAQGGACARTEA